MRKIKSREEIEQRKKRNLTIAGILMIGLLVLSTAGYSIFSGDNGGGSGKQTYGDFEFVRTNNLWVLEFQDKEFYFSYLPQELDNVSVTGFYSFQDYVGKNLYFVNINSGAGEILNNLEDFIPRYQEVCLDSFSDEEDCKEKELPMKNCSDNLIIFEQDLDSLETKVSQEDKCVFIEGNSVQGADGLLYRLLGVR